MSVLFGSSGPSSSGGGGGGEGGAAEGGGSTAPTSHGSLNSTLLLELKTFLYYDMLSKSTLFAHTDNFDFITSLVHHFSDEVVLPGDFIVRKGEFGREMYFILKGEASVLLRNKKSNIAAEDGPPFVSGDEDFRAGAGDGRNTTQNTISF